MTLLEWFFSPSLAHLPPFLSRIDPAESLSIDTRGAAYLASGGLFSVDLRLLEDIDAHQLPFALRAMT